MFCPGCGKSDQKPQTYCRQCGEFLADFKVRPRFGGETPEKQILISQFLTAITGLTGFGMGFALLFHFWGADSIHLVLFLAMAFSFVTGFWQTAVFFINRNLNSRLRNQKREDGRESPSNKVREFTDVETNELLPEADFDGVVPASVTERTTKNLKQKINRSSES